MVASVVRSPVPATSSLLSDMFLQRYIYSDGEQISQLLTERTAAAELLQDAPAWIESIFGANTSVRLEISVDPEYPQRQELWAYILTDMTTPEKANEAEQKLRRLHAEWLISLPRALSGSVHFDVEFQ